MTPVLAEAGVQGFLPLHNDVWAYLKKPVVLAGVAQSPLDQMRAVSTARLPVLPQDYWVNALMVKPYVRGLGYNLLAREQLKYAWIDANWRAL